MNMTKQKKKWKNYWSFTGNYRLYACDTGADKPLLFIMKQKIPLATN